MTTYLWIILELDGGLPQVVTWTSDKAAALEHYRGGCDALSLPYDDPHSGEADVLLFFGECGEHLAEYRYTEDDGSTD